MNKCKRCNKKYKDKSRAQTKIFCSSSCREKYWVDKNRTKHNIAVRKYRARKYKENGRWLDNSPKSFST